MLHSFIGLSMSPFFVRETVHRPYFFSQDSLRELLSYVVLVFKRDLFTMKVQFLKHFSYQAQSTTGRVLLTASVVDVRSRLLQDLKPLKFFHSLSHSLVTFHSKDALAYFSCEYRLLFTEYSYFYPSFFFHSYFSLVSHFSHL